MVIMLGHETILVANHAMCLALYGGSSIFGFSCHSFTMFAE